MKKVCLIITGLILVLITISTVIVLIQSYAPLTSSIALVRVEGPILESRNVVKEIKEYAEKQSVKAIVLRIDSPGGAVAPSQEIFEEVKKAAGTKSVVVSMGSLAASGGYYIAAPSTKIIANPGTLTGSIGVILEIPNVEGLMDKIGLKTDVIKSGKHKDMGSMFRTLRTEEREILQGLMDNVHDQFIRAVAESRGMDIERVRELADGRVFTGEQALVHGLVDELGTLEDAIQTAADMAGIAGKPEIISREEKISLGDLIRNRLSGGFAEGLFPTIRMQYLYTP